MLPRTRSVTVPRNDRTVKIARHLAGNHKTTNRQKHLNWITRRRRTSDCVYVVNRRKPSRMGFHRHTSRIKVVPHPCQQSNPPVMLCACRRRSNRHFGTRSGRGLTQYKHCFFAILCLQHHFAKLIGHLHICAHILSSPLLSSSILSSLLLSSPLLSSPLSERAEMRERNPGSLVTCLASRGCVGLRAGNACGKSMFLNMGLAHDVLLPCRIEKYDDSGRNECWYQVMIDLLVIIGFVLCHQFIHFHAKSFT